MAEGAISYLLSTVSTFIRSEFNLLREVRDEIDLIRGEFEHMSAFLQVAGANEDNDPQFEAWVKQVRDTAYDAGDVLEQFMARLEHHHHGGFYKCLSESYNFRKTIIIRHQIAVEVQRIKTKVNAISQSRQRYANHLDVQASSVNTVSTSTGYNSRHDALLLSENEIVGITNPKSKLIEWLTDEFRHELQVISVSGMGGLGKTTLVKKVYDDAEIVKFFEAHAWITVSKPFRIKELFKGLIKELYSELKRQVPDTVEDMDQYGLKRLINEFLQEKRYVIVLDDVWNTDVWYAIRYAFPDNKCSCRVILTTRDKSVASIGKVYILSPLPKKESLALFCLKAFKGDSCPPYLKETTEAILKKCSGLPLAIVSIGGLLATKDRSLDEWNKIYRGLGAELGKEGKLTDLERVLSLSYFDLPWYLKLCFLYLSIFPEGYLIDHWRLIRLWVAEGFVQLTPGLTPEEVADNYLKELLNGRSLILPASPTKNDRGKKYYVHDIWRELIFSRSIKQDMVTIFGAEQSSFPHRVRRLSIHSDMGNWQEIKKSATHVHSLFMFGSIDLEPTMSIMDSLRTGARLLKILDMRHSSLATFPRQIRKLLNLKYLSLRGSDIKEVPKSIGDLKMLETLDLKNTKVRKLPKEILKLHRLRHLLVYRYLDGPNYLCFNNHFGFKVPKGIEKLTCLQKLCSIEINKSDNDGILRDLAGLTQLRRINILQLRSKDADALCSTLDKLTELRSLSITMINENETLNLELFCYPPKFLQKLTITGQIETLPWWMSSLHNLTTLTLNYRKSNADPLQWLEYLPNLTSLGLNHAYEGVSLSFNANTFRQLTFLSLYSSVRLRDVRVMEGAMPRLKKLVIGECPSMKELPSGIETLRYLAVFHLVGMPEILISSLDRDMRKENSRKIAHIATVLIAPQSGAEAQFSYIL